MTPFLGISKKGRLELVMVFVSVIVNTILWQTITPGGFLPIYPEPLLDRSPLFPDAQLHVSLLADRFWYTSLLNHARVSLCATHFNPCYCQPTYTLKLTPVQSSLSELLHDP